MNNLKYFTMNEKESFPLFGDDGYRKVGDVLLGTYDGNPIRLDLMSCSSGNDNFKYYALTKFGERSIVVYVPRKNGEKRSSNKLLHGDEVKVGGHAMSFQVILS